jgi:hypothetical protein
MAMLIHAALEIKTDLISLTITLVRLETGVREWVVRACSARHPIRTITRSFAVPCGAFSFAGDLLSHGLDYAAGAKNVSGAWP